MRPEIPDPAAVVAAVRERLRNPTHLDCRAVGIDARALAAFRIVAGLLIVADVLLRSRNFGFYYTDSGAVPQSLAERMTVDGTFSVFFYTSDTTVIALLFVLTALVGVQLAVGYRTRIATVLAFLLVVSFDHHNPFVTSYADTLFRLLLLWAIFLPLGERWSVDAVHAESPPRAVVTSLASAAILVQMVFMYIVNGINKTASELWTSGQATPLVMGLDDMTFLLGGFVRQFPTLLTYGGLAWFYMLLSAWLLILLRGKPRILLVGAFIGAHASFAITVRIGAFAYVAIAGLLLFLPPAFWDGASARVRSIPLDTARLPWSRADAVRTAGRLPRLRVDSPALDRAVRGLFAVALVAAVLAVLVVPAIGFLPVGDDIDGTHDRIDGTVSALSVDQPAWSVFAPHPRTTDRYHVFPATTTDGTVVDVYNDRELTFDRPHEELQHQYDTYRERFYMNSVRRGGSGNAVAAAYADHVCETWGDDDGSLTHLNMYYVTEDVTLDTVDTLDERATERHLFHTHGCGDHEPRRIDVEE